MEISARVLREVEFSSSLRGYNTDEVDEFLESVADAVDRLQEEARKAVERAEVAERGVRDRPGLEDEESIRRTLVLAQRTADLAIREAQEEAASILDRARGEAESLVGDARDSASRITSEAERRLRDEVARLGASREGLRKEVDTLVSLLGAERERLTETLGAALRYVERSLSPSADLLSLTPPAPGGITDVAPGGAEPSPKEVVEAGSDAPQHDVEVGVAMISEPGAEQAPSLEASAAADAGSTKGDETVTNHGDVDALEAAIAEDAEAAAPSYARQSEPEDYDWDSVIRGRPEPLFLDRAGPRVERPNLTAVPSRDEPSRDTAAVKMQAPEGDWPA